MNTANPNSNIKELISHEHLKELLGNLLSLLPHVFATFIADFDGLIIAQASRKDLDESIIGALTATIDTALKRIKRIADTSLGSGSFDMDEYRLIFVELGGHTPAIFIVVTDVYSDIDDYILYTYLIAEKVSLILNNRKTSLSIPEFIIETKLETKTNGLTRRGKDLIIKIMVLGDTRVGKSALIEMFTNGEFHDNYIPTVGISIGEKELQISKSMKLKFHFFDMSGSKSFAKVRKMCYKNAGLVFVIFDFTNIKTLENARKWINESRQFLGNQDVKHVLIGNKIDLVSDRAVIREKAREIANENECLYFEASAQTGEGVDEIFTLLATDILNEKI
ncbi:MAG: GTP-binding protein [Candidatus Helarchaeota archaeon]